MPLLSKIKDPVSGLTHLAGTALSVLALVFLISRALTYGESQHLIAFTIFGLSMILLYLASSLYHLLPLSEKGTLLLRKFDHMMIYVLIAGTYTPLCIILLDGFMGWALFIAIWSLAALGILFKLVWFNAPKWLSLILYILMGWLAVVVMPTLWEVLPFAAIFWIFMGGLAYTIGAVIYGTKKPDPFPNVFGFHEIWHLFVMAGTFCHFWFVYSYLPFY